MRLLLAASLLTLSSASAAQTIPSIVAQPSKLEPSWQAKTRAFYEKSVEIPTLIDALYEHRVKLFAAADAEPAGLYPAGDGRFEFDRTISRLEEMQSADYLGEGHGLHE